MKEFAVEDYISAFNKLKIESYHMRMLQANYYAPNKTLTATELAKAVGYENYSSANLHYGKLGHLVGVLLGLEPLPEYKLEVLVDFKKPDQVHREWRWVLKPKVADAIERLGWVNQSPQEMPDAVNKPYTRDQFCEETGFDKEKLERWIKILRRKGQAILYGPPGTGKTFVAERLALHLINGGDGFKELVQFHPAYTYEDFMQGIRPKAREDGTLEYSVVPGRFREFCQRASELQDICVLIIDEINRANLARVFGELMYLLEYRDEPIPLAIDGSHFHIPGNVCIIGTMNTADRSIALVDHALRRRFAFLRLWPDYEILKRYHGKRNTGFPVDRLNQVIQDLNRSINDPHYELGISYFLIPDLKDHIEDIWMMEIEPYLEEYFFDNPKIADKFRWECIRPALGL